MKKSNNTTFYITCAIFSIVAMFFIYINITQDSGDILAWVFTLLFFGGGGICYYFFEKIEKKRGNKTIKDERIEAVVLLFASSMFVVCGYLFLPIHGIFEDYWRYDPTVGWIVGVAMMILFGLGVLVSIAMLIKPKFFLQLSGQIPKDLTTPGIQMSNEGLTIINGLKSRFIEWKDIVEISKDDSHFFVIHEHKNDVRETKIALSLINQYDIRQIESYINHKIKEHKTK